MLAADMQIDDLLNKVKLLQDRETELLDAIEGAVKVIKTLRDRADWYPAQRAQIDSKISTLENLYIPF